ncbi:MAG: LysE family transporter [Candidatus Lambdaproteobacteria bacterium]|nr:LysE family transporter [Candidatus Lambdaproteobacteria bacterium]
MDELTGVLALAGVWGLAVIIPGPDFMATAHTALSRSRAEGICVALGITLGVACWTAATLFGLHLLFRHWPWVYAGVKAAGAVYLLAVGVLLLVDRAPGPVPAAAPLAEAPRAYRRALRRGLLTNLSNPKAALLFGSLIAVMMPTQSPGWVRAADIAILVGFPCAWYIGVASLLSLPWVSGAYRDMKAGLDRLCGGIFLYLGVRFAAGN